MINVIKWRALSRSVFITAAFIFMTLAWCALDVSAQASTPPPHSRSTSETQDVAPATDAVTGPIFKDYKGVRIGMTADEVSQRLGKPELKDAEQEIFLISDAEMVQIVYDKDGKVSAVSITYSDKNDEPTALAVLGEDLDAGADGRVYKLVRYPTFGYWVAYSRTAGDAPVVSVTMKKIRVNP